MALGPAWGHREDHAGPGAGQHHCTDRLLPERGQCWSTQQAAATRAAGVLVTASDSLPLRYPGLYARPPIFTRS